jgi:membrane associated rhomboid family serine protease
MPGAARGAAIRYTRGAFPIPSALLPLPAGSLLQALREAPVTRGLVAANVLVFLLIAGASGALWHLPGAALIAWGSNYGPLTLGAEPWRMLSALFVHGGLLHVGLNMLALWQAGAVVEQLFGRWRFLALYLGAGLLASIASLGWRPEINSVGASGAIFGVIAALLVDLRLRRDLLPRAVFRRMRSGLLSFLGFSLFAGLALPGIDNAAHLGGLVGGALLGYTLAPRPPGGRWPDAPTRLVAALAAGGMALAAWLGTPPPAAPSLPPQAVPALAPPAEGAIRAFAEEERELVLGYGLVQDGVRRGRLSTGEALRIIEDELLPRWDRQIEQLAVAQGAAGEGADWRLPALFDYARLRHDALQALRLAIRTRNSGWLASSKQLQRQADGALLAYRMRAAGEQAGTGDAHPQE